MLRLKTPNHILDPRGASSKEIKEGKMEKSKQKRKKAAKDLSQLAQVNPKSQPQTLRFPTCAARVQVGFCHSHPGQALQQTRNPIGQPSSSTSTFAP